MPLTEDDILKIKNALLIEALGRRDGTGNGRLAWRTIPESEGQSASPGVFPRDSVVILQISEGRKVEIERLMKDGDPLCAARLAEGDWDWVCIEMKGVAGYYDPSSVAWRASTK